MPKRYFRCEATDPYSRVTLRCIHDRGHDGEHHDAFGDPFGVDDEPTDPGPIVYDPPLNQAEVDAYWDAISDDHEPTEPVRCVKCGGPDGVHDPACVTYYEPSEHG